MMHAQRIIVVCVLLLTIMVLPLQAATCYWNGATGTTNSWTNAAAWSGGIPGPTDDAVFTNTAQGRALLYSDTTVGRLTVYDGYTNTLMFVTGAVASLTVNGDLFLGTSATIRCTWVSQATNNLGTGRIITVKGHATINGTLTAAGEGFTTNICPGSSAPNLGAHGGYTFTGASVYPYGSLTNPTSLGSGTSSANGSPGGGAIRLSVGSNLTVNGLIDANGAAISTVSGAGGSLWIDCQNLAGTGTIRADSAVSQYTASGGRIALYYTNSTFSGYVSADSLAAWGAGNQRSQPGTLWEPLKFASFTGTPDSPATVIINSGYSYYFPSSTVTNYWNLTVNSNHWVEFHGGSLVISNLYLNGFMRFDRIKDLSYKWDTVDNLDMTNLTIMGNVTFTNSTTGGGRVWLPSQGVYSNINALTLAANYTVVCGFDTNAINADSGGAATNRHGAGVSFFCNNAYINGLITGSGHGFAAGKGPGYTAAANCGAHGGLTYSAGGNLYGNLTRPTELGSGGGGGPGGGAISIFAANNIIINGTNTVSGGPASPAGASGGSIRIACRSLSGSGLINANSDASGSSWSGGGGRIALEYGTSTFSGTITLQSLGGSSAKGYPGSLFRCTSPQPGIVTFSSTAVKLDTTPGINGGGSTATNGVLLTRNVTDWRLQGRVKLGWADTSSDLSGNALTNTVTYLLSGLGAGNLYQVYDNGALLCKTNSGPGGSIAFAVVLNPTRSILVQSPPQGTIFTFR